jgi:putative MATE family efflux protein
VSAAGTDQAKSGANDRAKFTTGSTMRHVVTMTLTGSIGLVAVFFVDALNLFYISMLGQAELSAAIGFAGTILFFTLSIAIGLSIGTGALVSRALGRGDRAAAAEAGGLTLLLSFVILLAVSLAALPFLRPIVELLGAQGRTADMTVRYIAIVLPSSPLIAVGMACAGILRGVGDARSAMMVTLTGAMVVAVADPILIFGLGLDLDGAAIATILSRAVILIVGLHGAARLHRLVAWPGRGKGRAIAAAFLGIGVPAIMTQLATPVGNAYVTSEMARFGDDAVAGWAIIGRVVPVAFGVIFALSGAVGPILGQNFGARLYHRLYDTMRDALIFTAATTLSAWALLALFRNEIASLFGASGLAADLVIFFCAAVAGSFLFNGMLFVANAAFNNLGRPGASTLFNWGRATLGTFPFVYFGGLHFGAEGVLAGWGLGAIVFGIAAMIHCFRVVAQIEAAGALSGAQVLPDAPATAQSPFTSDKGSL